jgi:ATP-dependent DNA helicase DinG
LLQLSTQLASLADATTDPSVAADFTAYANRSRDSASTLRQILDQSAPEMVYFAERNERRRETQLNARPLNVSELLRTHLFDKKRCVVMTSATLSTDGTAKGLGHFRERMGCQTGESLVLSSPFQLAKQVTVEIASDLPEPDHADFIDLAARRAGDAILTCGGGAFLLFTSFKMLDAFHQRLTPELTRAGIRCYRHSDDVDRSALLEHFRADGNGVLFGAESFWEGVDVRGAALRLVVIAKLPFPVPTLPIQEALAEQCTRKGENPFRKLFMPQALMRFRQGFGRLIRSETDVGTFLCLDSRIKSRHYGRHFLRALGLSTPDDKGITP